MRTHAQALAILQPKGGAAPGGKRRRGKRARPVFMPLIRPANAVVIGIDPGTLTSGWGIAVRGRLVDFGEIKRLDPAAIDRVLDAALLLAELASVEHDGQALPVVMWIERPPPVQFVSLDGRRPDNVAAVYDARGAWRSAWLRKGLNPRRVQSVVLQRWASRVMGRGWGTKKSELRRPEEQRQARARVDRDIGPNDRPVPGPDASPAVLITVYGCHAPETETCLVPRASARKRSRATR